MLTPSEIDLLRQDLKAALEREETGVITREREAFRRYQAAMAGANRHFVPQSDGVPTALMNSESVAAMLDCNAAHDAWLEAKVNVDRILDEIRSGKRQ
jgi:hypothetical protein